jgi:hypothetical protein
MPRFPLTSAAVFVAALLLSAPAFAKNVPADDPTKLGSPTSAENHRPAGPVERIAGTSAPMTGAPTSDLSASPPDPTNTGVVTAPATYPTDVMATGAAVMAPDTSGALARAADTSRADREPLAAADEDHGRWAWAVLLALLGLLGLVALSRRNAGERDVTDAD